MKSLVIILILYCVAVVNSLIPSYIKLCLRNDPKLADCITKAVYELLPRLKVGIPELDIPAIEPLHISDVRLNTGTDAARIDANLTDISIWNASNFTILEVIPKINKDSFRFKVNVPKIRLEGKYEIDSKVLFLELKGKGPLEVNITNYYFDCVLKGHKIQKENAQHLRFERMKCEIEFSKGSIILKNLFNGDPTIGKATNDVINDNLDAFFQEIKPALVQSLSSTFTDIANRITDKFNYNELFP